LIPITRPRASKSGPPEFPWLIGASVWIASTRSYFVVSDGIEPFGERVWELGAVDRGEALGRRHVDHREDTGNHRSGNSERVQLVDHAEVVVGRPEELGDGEVGQPQLLGQVPAVAPAVG